MRKVDTVRFGEIDVEEDKVVHFEQGIPAFEDEHEFIVIPYDAESPYYFMQSLATPDLAFLLTVPFVFFPEYEFELDDTTQKELGIKQQEEVLLYVLITIPGGKVEEGESSEDAAYRELEEETGISRKDIRLTRLMDITYYQQAFVLEMYVGKLGEDVELREEKNPLLWLSLTEDFTDRDRFAGEQNIAHIINIALLSI